MLNFDLKAMRRRCLAPSRHFVEEGTDLMDGPPYLIFQDNGAKILGVAHLDSVQDTTHFETVTIRKRRHVHRQLVFNGQLDDRLGVYLLLDYLPQLGLEYDVLLTDDEEYCASTAVFFEPPCDYNWIFSFDREGTDVVLYWYQEEKFKKALRKAGFYLGRGSYSDICELEHLGCCGFNVGTGLASGHSQLAHTDLLALRQQVTRFERFYEKNKEVHFEHAPPATAWGNAYYSKGDRWETAPKQLPSSTQESTHYARPRSHGSSVEQCNWCGMYVPAEELEVGGVCDECWGEYTDMRGDIPLSGTGITATGQPARCECCDTEEGRVLIKYQSGGELWVCDSCALALSETDGITVFPAQET